MVLRPQSKKKTNRNDQTASSKKVEKSLIGTFFYKKKVIHPRRGPLHICYGFHLLSCIQVAKVGSFSMLKLRFHFLIDFFIFILLSRGSGGGAMRRTNSCSLVLGHTVKATS